MEPSRLTQGNKYAALHRQGGVTRAHGMILMGNGRPEERHDAIAHDLIDGAFITVHRVHHPLQHRIQELAGLLRDHGRRATPSSP